MTEDCPRLEGRCSFHNWHHKTQVSVFNDEGTSSCFTPGSVWAFFVLLSSLFQAGETRAASASGEALQEEKLDLPEDAISKNGSSDFDAKQKGRVSIFKSHATHISPNSISLCVHRSLIAAFCPALSQCL